MMPFAGWWMVQSKGFLPAVTMGVVILAVVLVVTFYGELDLSRQQRSLLARLWNLWNLKHPDRYVAACFVFGALLSLALWLVLFDIALKDSGWHLAAIPRVARGILTQNGALSLFFVGLAFYPCWALGLALAYFFGFAQRRPWAYVLLSAVGATCVLSGFGSIQTLWLHVPATYFAFLSARAA